MSAAHKALVIQFSKFGLIGFAGFFVDYGLFHVGHDGLGFDNDWSAYFSFPFAVTATWLGNRLFTFKGMNKGSAHAQWMRFFAVCAIGFVLNRGTFTILNHTVHLMAAYPILGLLAGTGAGMFFNFFFSKKLVFR